MNGKNFLLSLNREKLFETYYENYLKEDFVFQSRMKESNSDPKKTIRKAFDLMMHEIEEIEPEKDDKYRILMIPYYDTSFEDNDEKIIEIADSCLVETASLDRTKSPSFIKDKTEIPNDFLFSTFSMMFIERKILLGYELIYVPEGEIAYLLAADYINELSWFGYSNESNEENMREEKEKLDKAIEESKDTSNLKSFSMEDLYKEFDIEPPTEEERRKSLELMDKVIVLNYNKKVEYYNKYIKEKNDDSAC